MSDSYQKIVRSGVWYYAGQTPTPVHIVRQNYDAAYELMKADVLEGIPWQLDYDKPRLNADGEAYYLLFGTVPSQRPWTVHGAGCMTADEAAASVTAQFGSKCDWI
jgi:hypothetical protein